MARSCLARAAARAGPQHLGFFTEQRYGNAVLRRSALRLVS